MRKLLSGHANRFSGAGGPEGVSSRPAMATTFRSGILGEQTEWPGAEGIREFRNDCCGLSCFCRSIFFNGQGDLLASASGEGLHRV
jgi:hypothetical protein